MNRREFVAMLMAGGVITAAGVWMPGEKVISIPSRKFFVPTGTLAWLDAGDPHIVLDGKVLAIPKYFDVDIQGFEIVQDLYGVTKSQEAV